jgi:hypothetical protein
MANNVSIIGANNPKVVLGLFCQLFQAKDPDTHSFWGFQEQLNKNYYLNEIYTLIENSGCVCMRYMRIRA